MFPSTRTGNVFRHTHASYRLTQVAHPPRPGLCENLRMSHMRLPPFFSRVCTWEQSDTLLTCPRKEIKGWEWEEEVAAVRQGEEGRRAQLTGPRSPSCWPAGCGQRLPFPLPGEPEPRWPGLAESCAKVCCGQVFSVTRRRGAELFTWHPSPSLGSLIKY